MSILSIPQILQYASNAGFSGSDLATAAAVALAETNPPGNSEGPYNPELKAGAAPGQGSYGLFQIYLTAHPQFDPTQLTQDPQYNASAAYAVYSAAGASFRPWTTYTSGKYLGFLPNVQAAISASSPAPAPATDGTMAPDGTVIDGTTSDQISTVGILGDGTNYWPLLIVGGGILFALMLSRG